MSLSSLLYQSAKNRFNSRPMTQSVTKASDSSGTQKCTYGGYNPKTGKHIFKGVTGENVEAEIGGSRGNVAIPTGNVNIVYNGNSGQTGGGKGTVNSGTVVG